ncbi:hypothetical protein IGI04_023499 [Brassica rapa subsp. trilocularis]|uniref:Uncharacterized protein n=1 Tax=Brassica rapa subsp. trilocularis TaxID=1813537 RepID=A0ABQ7M6F4_BRACM|nr:hypothetical protein IGI04_023499 [Brassica rapa subsp. trilocularis]
MSASTHRTFVAVRQHTQDVCGCSCVSVGTHRTSVAVHQYTYQHAGPWTQHAGPSRGLFGTHKTSVAVCSCPSEHTGRPCLSVAVRVCPCVFVCVCQHTQDVRGCPSVHISARWSLDSSTLALRVDCSGDFDPRGLSVQYIPDVRGCQSSHTGRWCVYVSTNRTSVAVRVCPSVPVSTQMTPVAVHQYTYQDVGPWTQHADPSCALFGTSVGVRQHTQDVCGCPSEHTGCPWLSVAVRVCPLAHTGRPWLSFSTHISTMVLGLSTLALPVDCLGDFGPRGLSVQYTQDVRGCPPAHTGRPLLSVSTHRTSVGVRVCPSAHTGRPWLSISTHISTLVLGLSTLALPVDCLGDFGPRGLSFQYTQDLCGCPSAHTERPWLSVCVRVFLSAHTGCLWVSASTQRMFMAICGCPSAHMGRLWLSVCVCVCLSAHTGRLWLSISTHISTLVLGLQHAGPSRGLFGTSVCVRQYKQDFRGCPSVSVSTHVTSVAVHQYTYQHVDPWTQHADPSRALFGTHKTSVGVRQHTQDVCGCPSEHTGCPWLSVCVCVCPLAHTGRPWLSFSTHISLMVLGLSTLALPVDCLGDFGPRGLSVQYTQDVRGCPPAHTGRSLLSVSTHRTSVGVRVCLSAHTGRPWLSISTHISTLVLGLSTLALPVDCSGRPCVSASTHKTSVTVCSCPSEHTGRPWLSVAVRVCPCVFVCVCQHTQDVRGCPSVHISARWSLDSSTLALRVDCSGDFDPRGLSVQYIPDVRGCQSSHTGRWCVYVSTNRTSVAVRVCPSVPVSTHMTPVAVHQYTYQHVGPWTQHADPSRALFGTSVGVRQHTQDVCGCPSEHTGCPWLSVCVCVCPLAHTGRPWLSFSTHISLMVLGLSTLALPVDCLGDFGPRGLSVQYTQDVRGCLPAHTGRSWLSVSTHRTSVGVRVCLSAHTGRPWLSISTHISTLVLGLSTLALPVDCSGDFGPRRLSVQYKKDVHVCPPAHTRRLWLSVAVLQNTQDVRACLWLSVCVRVYSCVSVSTHRTSVAVHQYTYQHAGPWTPARWPFAWTVRYIPDVRGCQSSHTGRWCVYVSTNRTSVAVRVCPSVPVSTQMTPVAVHQYTYQDVGPWTQHADPSCALFGTSVGVRQHTQDVCGCPSEHTGCPWLSVAVRVCPLAHTGRPWLSFSTHISTMVLGLSTLALPVDCLGDFGPRGLSVQYTQDVRGCPPAHTGRPLLSVSTHRTSVGVRVCPSAHTGRPWLSISTHISTLVLGLSTLALPVDCSGDFGPHRLSVQYTKDVHVYKCV